MYKSRTWYVESRMRALADYCKPLPICRESISQYRVMPDQQAKRSTCTTISFFCTNGACFSLHGLSSAGEGGVMHRTYHRQA
jgi:hypothetical protein